MNTCPGVPALTAVVSFDNASDTLFTTAFNSFILFVSSLRAVIFALSIKFSKFIPNS